MTLPVVCLNGRKFERERRKGSSDRARKKQREAKQVYKCIVLFLTFSPLWLGIVSLFFLPYFTIKQERY